MGPGPRWELGRVLGCTPRSAGSDPPLGLIYTRSLPAPWRRTNAWSAAWNSGDVS